MPPSQVEAKGYSLHEVRPARCMSGGAVRGHTALRLASACFLSIIQCSGSPAPDGALMDIGVPAPLCLVTECGQTRVNNARPGVISRGAVKQPMRPAALREQGKVPRPTDHGGTFIMTTHRARRTARSAALAAVTAALALGLTACGTGESPKAAGGDHAAGTAQSRSGSDKNGKGSAEQADSGATTTQGAHPTTLSGGTDQVASKGTTAGVPQCRGDEMLVTAVHRFAGQQGDHLLITAVNEGTKPCWVTSYPAVVLDWNGHNVALPHSKKDNPGGDKHITLRPGNKAYSAVNLFDYGSKNHTANSLAIALRDANGHHGPFYSVVMKGQKPQFSWNEADVLNWNTKKPYDF